MKSLETLKAEFIQKWGISEDMCQNTVEFEKDLNILLSSQEEQIKLDEDGCVRLRSKGVTSATTHGIRIENSIAVDVTTIQVTDSGEIIKLIIAGKDYTDLIKLESQQSECTCVDCGDKFEPQVERCMACENNKGLPM